LKHKCHLYLACFVNGASLKVTSYLHRYIHVHRLCLQRCCVCVCFQTYSNAICCDSP